MLEEIFEIDKSDLDFGIYRILNIRRKEINKFFCERLPQLIEQELKPFANTANDEIQKQIDEIEMLLGDKDAIAKLGPLPIVDKYNKLQQELASGFDLTALETDVYSALFSFFNRYYDEGDFISKRRFKNEIFHIDDIDSENVDRNAVFFAKIRAIKKVARIIIDFLAQLENFQKRLWLKKKFVVETNWCITLDNIDESFYAEIAANSEQTEEWVRLFAIDKIEADNHSPAFSRPLSVEFLKANTGLMLDTRFFSTRFRDRLLASIDNPDEKTNGVLINADNFHALRLIAQRYNRSLGTIYIDPPYNSPSSKILYKNSFPHSSWLTLIHNRIMESLSMMTDRTSMVIAIDENEATNLSALLKDVFPDYDISSVAIEHNKKGIQGSHFSFSHESAIFIIPPAVKTLNEKKRKFEDWDWSNLRNWGDESLRTDGATCFYPIYVKDNEIIGYGPVSDESYHPEANEAVSGNPEYFDFDGNRAESQASEGVIAVYPVDDNGVERKWRYAFDTIKTIISNLRIKRGRKQITIEMPKTSDQFKSLWSSPIYNAGDYGTKVLTSMGFNKNQFKFPKSIHTTADCIYAVSGADDLILDFFAGSGTTAHSIINLNRRDNSDRKYILVEMGEYFDTVTKPRVEKAVYSSTWSNGVPSTRNEGMSQIIKYMRLESYEDALSNVALKPNYAAMNFGDEYLINYMLDVESRDSLLNVDRFNNPFDFEMRITEHNECTKRSIDVVETFNYLIGLNVARRSVISGFEAATAENPVYNGAVELRENENGEFKFCHLEGTLPDGRRALVIWRNVTKDVLKSNAALDAYVKLINLHDSTFDVIFVNGDNNLENQNVVMTEQEFNRRMWEEA